MHLKFVRIVGRLNVRYLCFNNKKTGGAHVYKAFLIKVINFQLRKLDVVTLKAISNVIKEMMKK